MKKQYIRPAQDAERTWKIHLPAPTARNFSVWSGRRPVGD